MPRTNDRVTRGNRQLTATLRKNRYESMTTKERIAALDARLGKGKGAVKERARLAS